MNRKIVSDKHPNRATHKAYNIVASKMLLEAASILVDTPSGRSKEIIKDSTDRIYKNSPAGHDRGPLGDIEFFLNKTSDIPEDIKDKVRELLQHIRQDVYTINKSMSGPVAAAKLITLAAQLVMTDPMEDRP